MTEWQPIETAPKDGTVIDGWDSELGARVADIYWAGGPKRGMWWAPNMGYDGEDGSYGLDCMTHWQPLPDPPVQP